MGHSDMTPDLPNGARGTLHASLVQSARSSRSRFGPFGSISIVSAGCAIGLCSTLPSTASCVDATW